MHDDVRFCDNAGALRPASYVLADGIRSRSVAGQWESLPIAGMHPRKIWRPRMVIAVAAPFALLLLGFLMWLGSRAR